MRKKLSNFSSLKLVIFLGKSMFRNPRDMLSALYFSIVLVVLQVISFGAYQLPQNIEIGVTVVALVLCLLNSTSGLISNVSRNGLLTQIYLSGMKPAQIINGLLLATLVANTIVSVLLTAVATLLLGLDFENFIQLTKAIIPTLPVMCMVFLFVAFITSIMKNSLIAYVLGLPFLVPLLIFVCKSYEDLAMLKIILGMTLVYLPLLGFMLGKMLRNFAH